MKEVIQKRLDKLKLDIAEGERTIQRDRQTLEKNMVTMDRMYGARTVLEELLKNENEKPEDKK
jgi:hypothetical protein